MARKVPKHCEKIEIRFYNPQHCEETFGKMDRVVGQLVISAARCEFVAIVIMSRPLSFPQCREAPSQQARQ